MQQLAVHKDKLGSFEVDGKRSFEVAVLDQFQHVGPHLQALEARTALQCFWDTWVPYADTSLTGLCAEASEFIGRLCPEMFDAEDCEVFPSLGRFFKHAHLEKEVYNSISLHESQSLD